MSNLGPGELVPWLFPLAQRVQAMVWFPSLKSKLAFSRSFFKCSHERLIYITKLFLRQVILRYTRVHSFLRLWRTPLYELCFHLLVHSPMDGHLLQLKQSSLRSSWEILMKADGGALQRCQPTWKGNKPPPLESRCKTRLSSILSYKKHRAKILKDWKPNLWAKFQCPAVIWQCRRVGTVLLPVCHKWLARNPLSDTKKCPLSLRMEGRRGRKIFPTQDAPRVSFKIWKPWKRRAGVVWGQEQR